MPAQRKKDILRLVIKSIIVLSPYRVRLNYFYGGEVEATMDLERQSNREEIGKDLACTAGSYVFQRFGEGGI